nr:ATP-grasp domain-containing protein [Candidatus Njordarchaeota archaeon]
MQGEKNVKGKETAIVIGFNARPIASSAKRAGFTVLAVDYWGDVDLAKSADDIETILKQAAGERPREELSKPVCELLVECAGKISARHHGKVDFILVGSGLDDRPDLWGKLAESAPILGNSTKTLKRARNRFELYSTASKLGIPSPVTSEASSVEECLRASDRIGYPVILKPPGGGGGMGIRLANNDSEIRNIYSGEMRPKFGKKVFIQQYIEGEHVSASIMGDGDRCTVVTVNEQLIGLDELGARAPFIWCGNVVPLSTSMDDTRVKAIASAAKALGQELGLVGSNGFDFVLRSEDNAPVIIECNPRFQGTLECVETALEINLVREHVNACRGKLRNRFPRASEYVTKMIVFAKTECLASDISAIQGVGDISPKGVTFMQGDPICTIHRTGNTRKESIQNARNSVGEVYRKVITKRDTEGSY